MCIEVVHATLYIRPAIVQRQYSLANKAPFFPSQELKGQLMFLMLMLSKGFQSALIARHFKREFIDILRMLH